MGEISDLLQHKAGLSPDKAQEVEQIVVEYVQAKVPSEFQPMLGSCWAGVQRTDSLRSLADWAAFSAPRPAYSAIRDRTPETSNS